MDTTPPLPLEHLGTLAEAQEVARRAAAHVPAYGKHLAAASIKQPESVSWQQLPLVDKKNYLLKHSFDELLADDFTDSFTIFSSSAPRGIPSTGRSSRAHSVNQRGD